MRCWWEKKVPERPQGATWQHLSKVKLHVLLACVPGGRGSAHVAQSPGEAARDPTP